MPYIKEHPFDKKVIDNINLYIKKNELSLKNISEYSGLTYQQLYQLLHYNQIIKLREYVLLCKVFNEPLEKFICNAKMND